MILIKNSVQPKTTMTKDESTNDSKNIIVNKTCFYEVEVYEQLEFDI